MIESPTILTPASAQAEDARQAGAESLNGNGFYRFKIGNFQATVISDGYGPIPVGPIFAINASEAELAPVLKANFMQPVIELTNNPLVVDTEWNYWTGNRYESDVNSSPMPDPLKQATIGAARENLPPVADRSRFVKQGGN